MNRRAATDALWIALAANLALTVPIELVEWLTKRALEMAKGAKA